MSRYAEALADFRRRKDEHFAAGRGPVKPEALESFRGLAYFEADEAWGFDLPLQAPSSEGTAEYTLDTNTGAPRPMALIGRVTVPLPDGGQHSLSVFAPLGEEKPARVFLPFKDGTSGSETFGAGRYLDAPVTYGDEVTVRVDFNLAYHPYCAYSEVWTCPLPPPENVLPVAVRAGEKL